LEVWLVHGSFGGPEHFSDYFISFLMAELNIPRANIHAPDWGGNLNRGVRRAGGNALASEINSRHSNSDTNILIVSYSHGGNVSRRALNRLYDHYDFCVGNTALVTIATPMRTDYRLRSGVQNNLNFHINVFNDWDSVQTAGTIHANPFRGSERFGFIIDGNGRLRRVAEGRYAPRANNIRVANYIPRGFDNFLGTPAHSAMHSNENVWRRYLIELITFEDNNICVGD